MPKQVDHQERRQLIADAVCRLVGSQGLEAVSLRHVAAEAGVSMGQVQHYFATKDEMLLFAFHTLSERAEQRLGAVATGTTGVRSLLRALLIEMLPLTTQSRSEAPVWIAFLARALVEPRLAEPMRAGGRGMIDFFEEQIRAAREAGDVPAGLDPDREAVTLHAIVDGLVTQLLIGQVTAATAKATIDYNLDRIFPG